MLMSSRTGLVAAVAASVVAVLCLAGAAHGQSPLGVGSAEPSFSGGGFLQPFFNWINGYQQAFYRSLTGALKAMREDPGALWGLIGLSFAYGIFHAAGPGHATQFMEIASFALIAAFGAWLLVRKIRALRMRVVAYEISEPAPAGLSLRAGRPKTGLSFQAVEVDDHAYQGSSDYCEACGISHMPDPKMLDGSRFRLQEAWSAIVAVGLRPCSGAILVMSFSLLNSLYLGGILSVLAMSLGTAITVTILASLAVGAKDIALKIAGPGSSTGRRIGHALEIGGALFVLLIGLSLLGASLQA